LNKSKAFVDRTKQINELQRIKQETPQLYDPWDEAKVPTVESIEEKFAHVHKEGQCSDGSPHLGDLETTES
jgi:hypothetical protein